MEFKAAEMSADKDKEPEYVNFQRPPAPRHSRVCSGRRVKVAVLTVSVVSSVALIVAAVVVFFPRHPPRLYCDVGWKLNATNCYYFSTLKLRWSQSRTKCQDASGDLVKIESREEQRFLFGEVTHLMTDDEDKFWIGLTDSETEGEWKWIDGSALDPSLSFWHRHGNNIQPDNWKSSIMGLFYPDGEDCGRMGKKENFEFDENCWFDQHCGTPNRFICEKKAKDSPDGP